MDSVANWLIVQPIVAVAGIGPGEKAICWQYTNGVHAMISNAPPGTRGGGKVKTKALSPYQFDGAFGPYDDGLTAYRGAIVPAAQADTALYDADSLLINSTIPDSNVTIEHWKNWGGYKAILTATHGNTFGYDSLSQIRWKPTTDSIQGKSFWAKPYVTVATHVKADTLAGSKYWQDLSSGGKTFPRIIVVDIGFGPEYALTSKFFKTYNPNLKGALLSFGSCRSLYNDELWSAIRANGDASTAMIGYSDYVKGNFAGKAAEIIFNNLVNGKTLKQGVDSVVNFCGQNGNGFCTVKSGKASDSTRAVDTNPAFLEYRGDSNYVLVPRKGRVWAWGSGSGRGLYSCATINPDTVPNIKNISSVSGGLGHGLALAINGTVWGWGWNGSAQLGLAPSGGSGGSNPPTMNYKSCAPVQVFPGTGYKAIAAGVGRSLAVDAIGKVWRAGEFIGTAPYQWSTNGTDWWMQGVVGITPQRDTVPGLSNIISVAAGNLHNLALHSNGEVLGWGGNVSGELGLGDTLSRNTPVRIPGLSNIVAISTGQNPALGLFGSHSLALDRSGRVWAWGENEFGQLGLGDTLDRDAPQIIPGLSRIRSISAGIGGSSAVDSTGRLWVWGWNDQGQLALGNTNNQNVPTQVPALTNVVSVSHGMFPVILDNTGSARWSCGTSCGNAFVGKKPASLEVGSGGDEFGLSIAP
jgi:alpha-tubulin suppressor-like RCC1 family protein